jgi:hypothetical protein
MSELGFISDNGSVPAGYVVLIAARLVRAGRLVARGCRSSSALPAQTLGSLVKAPAIAYTATLRLMSARQMELSNVKDEEE